MADHIAYITPGDIPSPLGNAITRKMERVAPSDFALDSSNRPVLTTFATLQAVPSVSDHLEASVANDMFSLVMPPVHEDGRTTTVSTINNTEFTVRHDETESIHVGQQIFSDIPERELSIGTVGYFDSFSGRVFGRDENDRPVLIELRETSTAGGVLFTTVALNELAVSGNEQHRRDLLAALIAYLEDAIEDAKQVVESGSIDESSAEESEAQHSIPPKQYDAGLLTLYYYLHSDETVDLTCRLPEAVLPAGLSADFTGEEWQQFIEAAERDGLISDSGLQPDAVSKAVDQRNLRSFARRLEL